MNRQQYIERLKTYLSRLPEAERDDILRDQEEFIHDALKSGRSEDEVLKSLGDPKTFANNLIAESRIQKLESSESLNRALRNSVPAFLAVLALAPLNIFLVLGPFVVIVALIVAGWCVSAGMAMGMLMALVFYFAQMIKVDVDMAVHVTGLFVILGLLSASIFGLGLMGLVSKVFVRLTVTYLRWNMDLLRRMAR